MDINHLLIQAFVPLMRAYGWLILLLVLLAFLKSPFMKGVFGEFLVNLAARCFLDKQHYTQVLFSDAEVLAICASIQSGRLKPSIKTHRDHVQHVKILVEKKQRTDDTNCPKCGKPMILRTARSGANQGKPFLGCSDYPKCRMVRQLA